MQHQLLTLKQFRKPVQKYFMVKAMQYFKKIEEKKTLEWE